MNKQQNKQDDRRWELLISRAMTGKRVKSAQDSFIYAVQTTGIYCLPGCASRLPKRQNVRFFDDREQAKLAGFRPCKRCEPDKEVDAMTLAIGHACRLIDKSQGTVSLKELAEAVNLSTFHLLRQFKKHLGTTPKQYALAKKRELLQATLKKSGSVTEAIYEAGYGSASRAYEMHTKLGLSPGDYRRGGKGIAMHYSTARCALGLVLVATTEKGICCIELGESRLELESTLQKRFPHAVISEDEQGLKEKISVVVSYIDNPYENCAIPLDIQGTAFQLRVWNELQKIPAGSTLTYTEIAQRIEEPRAVRAVASAIAGNKLAVVIPCHRVIAKSGDLSGYRWGVERKRRLLDSERQKQK